MYMYVCKSVLNVNLHTYAYPYITSEFKLGKKRKNLLNILLIFIGIVKNLTNFVKRTYHGFQVLL